MPKRPLHSDLLRQSLLMLDLYQKQLELTKQMMRACELRNATMSEFIRANFTGDEQAVKLMAPIIRKGNGSTRPFYDDGMYDVMRTKQIVQQAREWSKAHEPKEGTGGVPALQAGSATDEAGEVPAAQGVAGGDLPSVDA